MNVRLMPPAVIVSVVPPRPSPSPSRDRSRCPPNRRCPCPCPRLRRHRSLRLVPPRRSFRPRRWCRRVPPAPVVPAAPAVPVVPAARSFPRCPSSRRVPRRRPFLPRPSSRPAPSLRPRRSSPPFPRCRWSRLALPRRSPPRFPRCRRLPRRSSRLCPLRRPSRPPPSLDDPQAVIESATIATANDQNRRSQPVTFIPFRRPAFVSIAASLSMCPLYVADHRTLIVDMSTSWLTNHLTAEAGSEASRGSAIRRWCARPAACGGAPRADSAWRRNGRSPSRRPAGSRAGA